jgi:tryptophan-rich sensory protein
MTGPWPVGTAATAAVVLCAAMAVLEGICAGNNVREFFRTLQFPRYSAPLWVWSIIGVAYYATFGFLAFRLLSAVQPSFLSRAALALLVGMMLGNALSNLVIFRARDLHLSAIIGYLFAGLDLILASCVLRLDPVGAAALAPYLVYRVYAVWWGRALARLNSGAKP